MVKGKTVDKGKAIAVDKGKKTIETKVVKAAQIDENTVYLEDVQKPRYTFHLADVALL